MTDTIEPMTKSGQGTVLGQEQQRLLAEELVEQARAEGVELIGPGGLLTGLTKTVLETALEEELSAHLGYDKHDPVGRNGDNSRNGTRAKTVLTDIGPVTLEVPRDRDSRVRPGDRAEATTLPGRGGPGGAVPDRAGADDRGGLGALRRGLRRQRLQGHRLADHREGHRADGTTGRTGRWSGSTR